MSASHDHGPHDHHDHRHHAHHDHDHGGHHHAPANFGRAFALGIALNTGFVALEAAMGIQSQSMALLADAGHNMSDVLGLVVAWIAAVLVKRPPNARYTYGLGGSSILAALFNAMLLLLAVGAIAWEAIRRLAAPEPVQSETMMAVAAAGILVNGFTAWLFARGAEDDMNVRGAFLHMAADAAVSAGVVIAGLLILWTGWLWLDPGISLLIVAAIIWSTWSLLTESLALSMNAVPRRIDAAAVRAYLAGLPNVSALHDLHIWPLSTTETALTAHLVMPGGHPGDATIIAISERLARDFGIGHTTLQIETNPACACKLAPDHVV